MNDIEELKQFVVVHARAQGLPEELYRGVLARVTHDGEGPGSWVAEWSAAARALEERGMQEALLGACQCWAMARFPYVDGPARAHALERCAAAFDRWRAEHPARPGIERVDVDVSGDAGPGRVRCWAAGLSASRPRPLLLAMGGIVSVKEQWGPVLLQADQLGWAMLVTELPGVGENTLRYGPESWRMLSAVLDALAGRADTDQTYASAMSFSGHLALRCAAHDPRIRGVVTGGAPISGFFTDEAWWHRTVPRITKDTLAHLAGLADLPADELFGALAPMALTPAELAALRIPVGYTVSLRDEIIPPGESEALAGHIPALLTNEYDDVHGSPSFVEETRQWTIRTLMTMRAQASQAAPSVHESATRL